MANETTTHRKQIVLAAILGAALIFLTPALVAVGQDSPPVGNDSNPIFEGTRSETFLIGPFALNPEGQPGDQVNRIFDSLQRPVGDIAVRSIDFELIDGDGNAVASHRAHLHHIVILDNGRPDALCGFGSRFAGTGTELNDFSLPDPYAYRSPEGGWNGVYHLMNRSDEPIDLAVQYTVTYSDGRVPDYLDVEPHFFDVDGCWGDSEFQVPGDGGPDSVFEKSTQYRMYRDANIVAGGGHIHAGGIDITMAEVDGPEICTATAIYGGHGGHHLEGIDQCGEIGYDVEVGDLLELTARYENDEFIPDAMGIMVMYLRFTGPPPPPPTIDITNVELGPDGLEVDVECNLDFDVSVYGSVQQSKGNANIYGNGYSQSGPCGPDGSTIVLPLVGNGVLTGGDVTYSVDANGSFGRNYAYDYETGTLRQSGRTDLGQPPLEQGTLDIVIDPEIVRGENGQSVVSIDVPCSPQADGNYIEVSAQVSQRAGREYLSAYGYDYGQYECIDGNATFDVEVFSGNGRLVAGPALVTASAYTYGPDYSYSTRSATVHLPAGERPGDLRSFDPDPDSALTIDALVRRDGQLVAQVAYEDCAAGSYLYLDGYAEALTGRGQRSGSEQAYGYGNYIECEGGDVTSEIMFYGDISGNRFGVEIYAYEEYYVDGYYEFDSHQQAGEFRVGR